jgi:hypothetical protein
MKGKKKCSHCTNYSMTGRVCWTHGAKRLRSSPPKGYKGTVQNVRRCSDEGCGVYQPKRKSLCQASSQIELHMHLRGMHK